GGVDRPAERPLLARPASAWFRVRRGGQRSTVAPDARLRPGRARRGILHPGTLHRPRAAGGRRPAARGALRGTPVLAAPGRRGGAVRRGTALPGPRCRAPDPPPGG